MPKTNGAKREFDSSASYADIREFVSNAVRTLGGSDDDVFAYELAADEAASNVFRHAYAGRGGKVEVKVWREGGDLVVRLRDWGRPFDPDTVVEPNMRLPLDERPVGGLGLYLIRKVMNQVTFAFDPQDGNSIIMRRRACDSAPKEGD